MAQFDSFGDRFDGPASFSLLHSRGTWDASRDKPPLRRTFDSTATSRTPKEIREASVDATL